MTKTLIFGNSGSGKSTLAKKISTSHCAEHLDLDSIAWLPISPPTRMPIAESKVLIKAFFNRHQHWVIEGCYSDLLELIISEAHNVIFLNLSIELCIDNAKNRPWEPHKYESKAVQDANVDMLINWISQYDIREDAFSKKDHLALYHQFTGVKEIRLKNLKE